MNPFQKKQQPDGPPPLTTPGEKPQPAPKASPKPPQQEQPAKSVTISPEAVAFRTSDQVCESCSYMGKDGMCSALEMAVEPKDSCGLHSPSGGEVEAEEELPQ